MNTLPSKKHPVAEPGHARDACLEFLADMNHDLRTPLNAVIGFAQIIEKQIYGQVCPQYLEYARHIQESGYNLLAKIEDMLEFAELEAIRAAQSERALDRLLSRLPSKTIQEIEEKELAVAD